MLGSSDESGPSLVYAPPSFSPKICSLQINEKFNNGRILNKLKYMELNK